MGALPVLSGEKDETIIFQWRQDRPQIINRTKFENKPQWQLCIQIKFEKKRINSSIICSVRRKPFCVCRAIISLSTKQQQQQH